MSDIINSKNEKIVEEFEKLIDQIKYDIDNAESKDKERKHAFRLGRIQKALSIIKKFPKEITSSNDLKGIKWIGKGTLQRIDEILSTGKLSEVSSIEEKSKYFKFIELLEKVVGIGRKTAIKLIEDYDIKSVEELKQAYNDGVIELNNKILTGLKYYNVYQENIPRAEIDKIYNYIADVAMKIDPELLLVVCGSYRRLKLTSGDIDILMVHPKIKTKLDLITKESYLIKLINELKSQNFLLDALTDKDYETKYMGFCQYKENSIKYPVRRIDFEYVPYESYYPALLYFTGSGPFNQRMRQIAKLQGYLLNQNGLYKLKGTKKIRIKVNSEQDIFEVLGMEYLDPEMREADRISK